MSGVVKAVSRSKSHTFSKPNEEQITLIAGHGVEGDAHAGATVKHLSRILKFGNAPNLRQVHLIHEELFDELRAAGFSVAAGQMGENVTTEGIDLLNLPKGARLHLGNEAIIEITGLRNPCRQLNKFQPGLMAATLARDVAGNLKRKAGVMGIVLSGGDVKNGDPIRIELPEGPHDPLLPV
ncbi:MAG: MOSC domain-containing protein [Alphaproteobacteria bacterium]|nr:MOSC domain-containing protein [Alphaproteobacteria bacterium]